MESFNSVLNSLTLETIDYVSGQIIDWVNKSGNEKGGQRLFQVTQLVYEKAMFDGNSSAMYARLCHNMMVRVGPNVHDDGIRNAEGKPAAGAQLFRKYLLNRCQEGFERGLTTASVAATKSTVDQVANTSGITNEATVPFHEYYASQEAKNRRLALIKFLGELFKLRMVTERIIHECIKGLLADIDDPVDENLECLWMLFLTVGPIIDTNQVRTHMDIYFARIKHLSKNPKVRPRVQFLLLVCP